MSVTIPKPKIKLLSILTVLIATILLLTPIATEVQAIGYNGGQGIYGVTAGGLTGGASAEKTAIQLYIYDKQEGKVLDKSVGIVARTKDFLNYKYRLTQCKLGKLDFKSSFIAIDMPYPVIWTGSTWVPNGDAVREWLLADGSGAAAGMKRYEYLVEQLFGTSTLTRIQLDKSRYEIIIEPVAWMHFYIKHNGYYLDSVSPCLATSDGWASLYSQLYEDPYAGLDEEELALMPPGLPKKYTHPYGDIYLQKFTHMTLPFSLVLDEPAHGLGAHAGESARLLSNNQILSSGFGIHIIQLENGVIHTYDAINSPGKPEKAEGDKKGTSNIVKCYYTEKKENGVIKELINDGTFTREQCTNKISIDNEPEYQIEKWIVSSTYDPTVQSTLDGKTVSFDVPATIQETGTSAEVKTLSDPKSTVYVLLKHSTNQVINPPVTGVNYEISESSITRRIWFSTPDSQGSMPQIASYTFLWTIGAHKTACDGHKCSGCTCFGHAGSHDSSCPPGCSDDHTYYCGSKHDCVIHYCSGWKWKERMLLLSIDNPYKEDYPDILATKSGWQTETEVGAVHKHYYINDSSFSRASTDKQYYPHYQIW